MLLVGMERAIASRGDSISLELMTCLRLRVESEGMPGQSERSDALYNEILCLTKLCEMTLNQTK